MESVYTKMTLKWTFLHILQVSFNSHVYVVLVFMLGYKPIALTQSQQPTALTPDLYGLILFVMGYLSSLYVIPL